MSGNDGLVFENNTLTGGDLMSTGGGLNCLDGSTCSQNVYYAHNRLRLLHGWDREAMTTDAGGEAYFGKLTDVQGTAMTLAEDPKWGRRPWAGAGVFVLAGKGAGQYRRVVSQEGRTVQIDRPWTVAPDGNSDIGVTMFQGGYLVIDNDFTDTGAVQFYGTSIECVLAGNRGTHAEQGVFVSQQAAGVLVAKNDFEDVELPVVDEEALRKAAEEKLRRYLGRQEPVAVWTFDAMQGKKFADGSGNGFLAALDGDAVAVAGGVQGRAVRFGGAGYLRVEEPAVFNAPDITVAFWMNPATVSGRRGLVAKRFAGTGAPWVISQNGANLGFEAAEENGIWTFNFQSPPVLQANQWTHVAVVAQRGVGGKIFADGKLVAEKPNAADRAANNEPLIMGREAWGGDPPSGQTPGPYVGLLDEVKIWTRALTPDEIQAQAKR